MMQTLMEHLERRRASLSGAADPPPAPRDDARSRLEAAMRAKVSLAAAPAPPQNHRRRRVPSLARAAAGEALGRRPELARQVAVARDATRPARSMGAVFSELAETVPLVTTTVTAGGARREEPLPAPLLAALRAATPRPTLFDCGVCMEPVAEGDEWTRVCGADCPAQVCAGCLREHLSIIVRGTYTGVVPRLTCPACPRRLVPLRVWSNVLDSGLQAVVRERCEQQLSLQCGGCHSRNRSLLMPVSSAEDQQAAMAALARAEAAALHEALPRFLSGALGMTEMHDDVLAQQVCGGDEERLRALMPPLLGSIQDVTARALLQLRHVRTNPRVFTHCCNREHCFNCRIRNFHTGQTCAEYQAANRSQVPEELAQCPACFAYIVKGDGCSSLSCICGHRFSWGTLVQQTRRRHADEFLALREFESDEAAVEAAAEEVDVAGTHAVEAAALGALHAERFRAALATRFEAAAAPVDGRLLAAALHHGRQPADESPAARAWAEEHRTDVERARRTARLLGCMPFVALCGGSEAAAARACAVRAAGGLTPLSTLHPALVRDAARRTEAVCAARDAADPRLVERFAELHGAQVQREAQAVRRELAEARSAAAGAFVAGGHDDFADALDRAQAIVAEPEPPLAELERAACWLDAHAGDAQHLLAARRFLARFADVHEAADHALRREGDPVEQAAFRQLYAERLLEAQARAHAEETAQWAALTAGASERELAAAAMDVLMYPRAHACARAISLWAREHREAMADERERRLALAGDDENHRNVIEKVTHVPVAGCFCRPAHSVECPRVGCC